LAGLAHIQYCKYRYGRSKLKNYPVYDLLGDSASCIRRNCGRGFNCQRLQGEEMTNIISNSIVVIDVDTNGGGAMTAMVNMGPIYAA
jgi:hypothetical protein